MDRRADEKTHWGDIDGDDGWTTRPTDFLPPSPKFSCSTMLNLGEVFTQLGFALSDTSTSKGCGTNRRPLSLPFPSDPLRLLSLYGVLVFPFGQVRFILRLPLVMGITRNRFRRRV